MNGRAHQSEAERCLNMAREVDFDHAAFLHREAQVHATLALVDAIREASKPTIAQAVTA